MRTILKYNLEHFSKPIHIDMPLDAEILSVHLGKDFEKEITLPMLWAVIPDSDATLTERRTFFLAGTGDEMPEEIRLFGRFLGTVQTHGGKHVWHCYETTVEYEDAPKESQPEEVEPVFTSTQN